VIDVQVDNSSGNASNYTSSITLVRDVNAH
jgi:hypothetical protein